MLSAAAMKQAPMKYAKKTCHGIHAVEREMFGTKGGEWRRVENRPEQNHLVESSRFLPVAAKKNHNQPDGENHSPDRIRPDHLARNCEECHNRRRIR
jgi:hypothetical protein